MYKPINLIKSIHYFFLSLTSNVQSTFEARRPCHSATFYILGIFQKLKFSLLRHMRDVRNLEVLLAFIVHGCALMFVEGFVNLILSCSKFWVD